MLLAIDAGNTNTVIGLFDGDRLKDHLRISSRNDLTADEAGLLLTQWLSHMTVSNEQIDDVVVASVVPPLTTVYETVSKRYCGCLPTIVNHTISLPISIEIDRPEQVGADRIANAAAGFAKINGPVVIVDFGTATTFDVVNKQGAYIGGIIIPGPETSMGELARKAAQLFEIQITPPKHVIGKSTAEALQAGLFFGTVGQVDHILERIFTEMGDPEPAVIATGGFAKGIEQFSNHIKLIEPTLTLEGLYIISKIN